MDKKTSEKVLKEKNELTLIINEYQEILNNVLNNMEIITLLELEFDEEMFNMVNIDIDIISEKLENFESKLLLDGEYDNNDAILEIKPGAGGTESCDWANMLYRMYTKYASNNNFKIEIIDTQIEDVGIKGVTMIIKGTNAFGLLKEEKGVHRLVRISPFDSNSRRHTSFASVDVTPKIEQSSTLEINEVDLKIDVYRSSGAGGQSVNTTDSAVRITHLPTKIVVTCQNERSQIQNKEKALEILKNKIFKLEEERKKQELNDLKGAPMDVNFGSQIRSYVMHPYMMVKDHRTSYETANVLKVLDGDLNNFINASLRKRD